MGSNGNYKSKMAKWRKQIAAAPANIQQSVASATVALVIERTPRATGHTRAQWNASLNAPDTTVTDSTDYEGGKTIRRALAVVRQIVAGSKFFFTNGVPWIRKLENGSSAQAPAGMVAITVAEMGLRYKRWFRLHLGGQR
jgi:hypothetical protein